MQDMLRDTWVYQEIKKEGLEEGEKRGLQQGLEEGEKKGLEKGKKEAFLQFVEIRFPTLLAQAKQVVEQETSVERLRVIFNQFYRANTIEEAQAALLGNR